MLLEILLEPLILMIDGVLADVWNAIMVSQSVRGSWQGLYELTRAE